MLVPIGINFASTSHCTPNGFAIDPTIYLYFLRSMSAKVPIQAGHVGLSFSFGFPIPTSSFLNLEPTYVVVNLYAEDSDPASATSSSWRLLYGR